MVLGTDCAPRISGVIGMSAYRRLLDIWSVFQVANQPDGRLDGALGRVFRALPLGFGDVAAVPCLEKVVEQLDSERLARFE